MGTDNCGKFIEAILMNNRYIMLDITGAHFGA